MHPETIYPLKNTQEVFIRLTVKSPNFLADYAKTSWDLITNSIISRKFLSIGIDVILIKLCSTHRFRFRIEIDNEETRWWCRTRWLQPPAVYSPIIDGRCRSHAGTGFHPQSSRLMQRHPRQSKWWRHPQVVGCSACCCTPGDKFALEGAYNTNPWQYAPMDHCMAHQLQMCS